MKAKWGLIFGAALSAIALAACGGSGGSNVSTNGNSDLFTTAGFQKALDAVKDKAGDNARRSRSRSPRAAPTSSSATGSRQPASSTPAATSTTRRST